MDLSEMGSLWNQIRPIIGRPNRVNRFLYDIYKEEIAVDRQRSKAEIHDIGTAVNDMISAIVGQAFETDTVFNIPRKMLPNHIIGVGSFFEQTKIIDVNEFDFTVVLPYFTSENVRVVKELHSPYVGCRHGVRKNPFAFVELEYVGKNADILTKKNLLTTIKSKRYIVACGLYTFAKEKIDDCLSGPRKVGPVFRETGTLEFNVNGFGSKSYPNGPALKLYLKWWQNWGHNNLDITVDLVPVIKTSIPKNMSNNITAPYVMRKEVTKSNCCFFIPKNKRHVSVDFIISFSQVESQLLLTLRKEKPSWFMCYNILKFLFWNDSMLTQFSAAHLFSSYILKAIILQESLTSTEKGITLVDCLMKILVSLQRHTDTIDQGIVDHIQVRSVWFLDSSIVCRSLNDRFEKEELNILHTFIEQLKNMLIDIDRDYVYEYSNYKKDFLDIVKSLRTSLSDLNQERKSKYSQVDKESKPDKLHSSYT